ncbi:general odorant-binding protein 70 [Anthonomus grandis grandis]|uniref:general odorant-binding protein 70 n=1 Tax=Anthonomus grandis grandis TaxID=2921223 RepID=UPI002166313F|nr:general odorant-binding protein 70 [Anthonomus grandis grandis]
MCGKVVLILVVSVLGVMNVGAELQKLNHNCEIPATAPKRIEEVINTCQDEIKIAILSEALEAFNVHEHKVSRTKRSTFNEDEKKIAGCLLQCVYRKMNAVNENGFPTVDGLVALYTEGVTQKEYVLATLQAVTKCLGTAQKKHFVTSKALEAAKSCDVAYDVFDCVSEEVAKYCGQTP